MEYGIELVDGLWCIWKKEQGKTYWLDINKKFDLYKGARAGLNCIKKANKLMQKVCI